VSVAANDLSDRDSILCQSKNGSVGFFSTEVAFILNTLGCGEQARIDCFGADCGTDLPHGFLNGIKKGTTGVLHEMPAVGNLDGIRERFGRSQRVTTASVAGDHGNPWLATEPSLRRGRFAVRQQGDHFASFQVANDRSVALVSPPRPVVDPYDRGRCKRWAAASSDDTKKGVIAHRKHESPSETCRRAATESKPEVVDDIIEPARAPRPQRQNAVLEALREDTPTAQISPATETACYHDEAYRPTCQGQVGDAAQLATVDSLRTHPASGTRARPARTADGDHRGGAIIGGVLHHESERDQGGWSEGLLHGVDSL
jgi:hypothetical protein